MRFTEGSILATTKPILKRQRIIVSELETKEQPGIHFAKSKEVKKSTEEKIEGGVLCHQQGVPGDGVGGDQYS